MKKVFISDHRPETINQITEWLESNLDEYSDTAIIVEVLS